MGIDYIIGIECEPKQALTLPGLMERLKARVRAEKIIQLYRDEGDYRPPSEMAFEMVRHLPDGTEESELVVVQNLLDLAQDLKPWEAHCQGCPANVSGRPFGCTGAINYPLSVAAEEWLLDQLPDNRQPLVFMLLQKAVRDMGFRGEVAATYRAEQGIFFESADAPARDLGAIQITGDQVFEMLFLAGPIYPGFGSVLLQFFGGISRDLDADVMMQLARPPSLDWIEEHIPFLLAPEPDDSAEIGALKQFFHTLYVAYRLGVPLLLDV